MAEKEDRKSKRSQHTQKTGHSHRTRCTYLNPLCLGGGLELEDEDGGRDIFVVCQQNSVYCVYAKPVFEPSTMNVQYNPCYVMACEVKHGPFQLELETL